MALESLLKLKKAGKRFRGTHFAPFGDVEERHLALLI